jgi:predicted cobalt transporter CbtA
MCAMRAPRDLHRTSTRALSTVLVALGFAMIVVALAGGGGPLSTGVIVGLLFVAAGAGRLWVARR